MNPTEILNSINTISQKVVSFLFGFKYTFWIIGFLIVVCLVWKGVENKEKKKTISNSPQYQNQLNEHKLV